MRTRSKWRFCVFWHVCQKTLGDSLLKNDHFFTKRKKCQKWLICKKCKNDITLGVTHVFALFEKCQKRHFRDFGIFAKKCPRNCLIKKWPFCKNGKKRQKPCFWKVSKIDTFGHFLTLVKFGDMSKMTCHPEIRDPGSRDPGSGVPKSGSATPDDPFLTLLHQ